jgi:hypothetical protein
MVFKYFSYVCIPCGQTDSILQNKFNPNTIEVCTRCKANADLLIPESVGSSAYICQQPDGSLGRKGKLQYYGVTNIHTGAGITRHTDVSERPGIRVRPLK